MSVSYETHTISTVKAKNHYNFTTAYLADVFSIISYPWCTWELADSTCMLPRHLHKHPANTDWVSMIKEKDKACTNFFFFLRNALSVLMFHIVWKTFIREIQVKSCNIFPYTLNRCECSQHHIFFKVLFFLQISWIINW